MPLPPRRGAGHRGGLPSRRPAEHEQTATLGATPAPAPEWSALSLRGLQEVTVQAMRPQDVRALALAVLTQWRRDVDSWGAELSKLRQQQGADGGGAAATATAGSGGAAAADHAAAEAADALAAVVAAEAAGAPTELVQELRRDADAKAAEASQAREGADAAAGGSGGDGALCSRLFYEHGPDEIPLTEALALLHSGDIRPSTLIFSDEAAFAFDDWTPWAECCHCFLGSAGGAGAGAGVGACESFYYSADGEGSSDELPLSELRQLLAAGEIVDETLLFSSDARFGFDDWTPWEQCRSLFGDGGGSGGGGRGEDGAAQWRARLREERGRAESAAQRLRALEQQSATAAGAVAAQCVATREAVAQAEQEASQARAALATAETARGGVYV